MAEIVSLDGGGVGVKRPGTVRHRVVLDKAAKQDDEDDLEAQQKRECGVRASRHAHYSTT